MMLDRKITRYDNTPTADLEAMELQMRIDQRELQAALRERLIAEAKERIIVGEVYRVTGDGHLAGRLMLVEGVNSGPSGYLGDAKPFWTFAWGRMNGKSAAGDGWTIKRQQVSVKRLERVSEKQEA